MRTLVLLPLAFILGLALGALVLSGPTDQSVTPVFSQGARDHYISFLRSANKTIDVELYQFSDEPLMWELVRASERGLNVRVILEPRLDGDDNIQAMAFLRSHGIMAKWAPLRYRPMHGKLVIADGAAVLLGSNNWSRSAMDRNREYAIIVRGPVALDYLREFERDWNEAS